MSNDEELFFKKCQSCRFYKEAPRCLLVNGKLRKCRECRGLVEHQTSSDSLTDEEIAERLERWK